MTREEQRTSQTRIFREERDELDFRASGELAMKLCHTIPSAFCGSIRIQIPFIHCLKGRAWRREVEFMGIRREII
jgi:hypothetical protein